MSEPVSLREHFEALLAEYDKRYEQRFDAQGAAVQKAEVASEKRFDSVNEFRATLADQQRMLMPRTEAEVEFRAIKEKQAATQAQVDALRSERTGNREGWGYAVGVVGFIAAAAAIISRFV